MDAAEAPEPGTDEVTPTERAVLGATSASAVRTMLDGHLRHRLGSGIRSLRFRSGRIDAVWGLELEDGREVVVKAHRPPVRSAALSAAGDAQRLLVRSGFPAPQPVAGPDRVDGHVLSVESLLPGAAPDGHDPAVRGLLARELARSIELLRGDPGLLTRVGEGPSWWRYQAGPWPVSHDPIVDLDAPTHGYEWLTRLAERAAAQILDARDPAAAVVAHADWYASNALVADGRLTGIIDWELIADDDAVVAGSAAASVAGAADGGGLSAAPETMRAFLDEYGEARGRPLSPRELRAASGAIAWVTAFDARWQVGLLPLGIGDAGSIETARLHGETLLAIGN